MDWGTDKLNDAQNAVQDGFNNVVATAEGYVNDVKEAGSETYNAARGYVKNKWEIAIADSDGLQEAKPTYETLGTLDNIRSGLTSVGQGAASAGKAIGEGVTPGFTSFAQEVKPVLTGVGEGATPALTSVGEGATPALTSVGQGTIASVDSAVSTGRQVGEAVDSLQEWSPMDNAKSGLTSIGQGAASAGKAIGEGITPGFTGFAQEAKPVLTSVGEGATPVLTNIGQSAVGVVHYGGVAKKFVKENVSVEKMESLSDAYKLHEEKEALEAENGKLFLELQEKYATAELAWYDNPFDEEDRKVKAKEFEDFAEDIITKMNKNDMKIAKINEKTNSYGRGEKVAGYLGERTRTGLNTLGYGTGTVIAVGGALAIAGISVSPIGIAALLFAGGTYGSYKANEGKVPLETYNTFDEDGNRKYQINEVEAMAKPVEFFNAVLDGLDLATAGTGSRIKVGGAIAQSAFDVGTYWGVEEAKDYFKNKFNNYWLDDSEENDEQE